MSNQEMQFNDPTWRSPEQRNRNADMREQSAYAPQPINWDQDEQEEWQIPPHSQQDNYVGEQPYIGPQPQKIGVHEINRPRTRHRGPWLWIIFVVIMLTILAARSGPSFHFSDSHFAKGYPDESVTESHSYTVSPNAHPIIVINNDVGNIRVDVGKSNDNVSIDAVKQANSFQGNPKDIHVNIHQSGDVITANVDNGVNPFNAKSVEFDVIVPANTDLQLKTDSGEIEVNGVNGKLSLTTNTGSIVANGDRLANQSSLSTNLGSITFDGSTDVNGNYNFQADTGSVNLTLPANSSFHLDATTDTGTITSDFPVKVETNNSFGGQVHSDVGTPSSTEVSIKTATGSITLNKG